MAFDPDQKPLRSQFETFFWDELKKWLIRTGFAVIAGITVYLSTPVGERLAAMWHSPEKIEQMQAVLQTLVKTTEEMRNDITIVQAPDEIVEYGPASRFKNACRAGEICLLTLEIRRTTPSTKQCQIIPGLTEREIVSTTQGYVWAPELAGGEVRNIGENFSFAELRLKMPDGLIPGEYYYRQTTYYTDCGWQRDGKPPVKSVSPRILITIIE